jgi:energy-coupling factor transporter ATP-binding protein EcfA2
MFVVDQLPLGRVTGFLGPNGAGKTTTLRMLLGLVEPTGGGAEIGRIRYAQMEDPVLRVGAVLEASGAHEGRTGRDHLRGAVPGGGAADVPGGWGPVGLGWCLLGTARRSLPSGRRRSAARTWHDRPAPWPRGHAPPPANNEQP